MEKNQPGDKKTEKINRVLLAKKKKSVIDDFFKKYYLWPVPALIMLIIGLLIAPKSIWESDATQKGGSMAGGIILLSIICTGVFYIISSPLKEWIGISLAMGPEVSARGMARPSEGQISCFLTLIKLGSILGLYAVVFVFLKHVLKTM